MVELKTKETDADVEAFLETVEPPRKRDDAAILIALMQRVTGWPAKMWGKAIIGFGAYNYTYDSGHSGRAMVVGFSPRKANLVLYIMNGFSGFSDQLAKLGKHKTGKSCLYINKLADIDQEVLETMIYQSVAYMKEKYKV